MNGNLKNFHEKKGFSLDDNYKLFAAAALTDDNIEMMEYLVLHNCPISPLTTSKSAAWHGALNNLKWLLKKGFLIKNGNVFDAAIESDSLDVLKWLKGN